MGAYFSGRCAAYTTDASGLASTRNKEAKNPDEHMILPDLISKEPLGPMVRRGDDEWFAVVKWVVFERNVGNQSPLKLPRGLNKQWNKGGLMYAPPIR